MSIPKFQVGDYIRWKIGISVFSASAVGVVNPVEYHYDYGIVIEVAEGNPEQHMSDVIIAYSTNNNTNWIVAHIDDDEYNMELISRAGDHNETIAIFDTEAEAEPDAG